MDRTNTDFASRRRTLDVPAKPEAGLAEWTSKIKELQRQVDEDEEAETRRLEEEIKASRLARMRRSTGRGTSTDLSTTDVAAALKESRDTTPVAADQPRSADERRKNQDDALKRLAGDGPNRGLADYNSYVASRAMTAATGAPMSLAAFIGGKATGPRLNKQAPQDDPHDPTKFDQRTITGPHPVFGRGGIAMPGMVGKIRGVTNENRQETPSPKPVSPWSPNTYAQSSSPRTESFSVKSVVEKVQSQRVSAAAPMGGITRTDPPRQRTFSTPLGPSLSRATFVSPASEVKPEQLSSRVLSHSPSPVTKGPSRPSTPKDQGSPANNHVFPTRANTVSPLPRSPVVRSSSPPKTPTLGSTPGLAKPIQPTPRKSLQGPQIPLTQSPSSSFLRPPPTKEPTPSISRLQGRGFVQSMVRVSSQLEANSGPGSPSSTDKGNESSKKASVLDRWQRGGDVGPVIAPNPLPLRKVRTVDHSMHSSSGSSTPVQIFPTYTPPPPKPEKPDFIGITLKSRASLPSISSNQEQQLPSQKGDGGADSPTPSQRRNLGSSSTMVSYIKPIKTGDGPGVASPPSRPSSAASRGRPTAPGVDELGVRVRSRTRSVGDEGEEKGSGISGTGAGGKPLNHPTKSRPHKPRKAKITSEESLGSKHEAQVDRSNEHNHVAPAPAVETVKTTPIVQEKPVSNRLENPTSLPRDIRFQEVPRSPLLDDDTSSGVSESPPTQGASRRVHFPLALDVSPAQPVHHAEKVPSSPIRHSRIPSTGNRATVMDVVQAFTEHEQHTQVQSPEGPKSPHQEHGFLVEASPVTDAEEKPIQRPDVKSMVASWGSQNGASTNGVHDQRKSSYEKYSAFTLPPLVEEKTPVPSPADTLTRGALPSSVDTFVKEETMAQPSVSDALPGPAKYEQKEAENAYIHIAEPDEALPSIDVDALLIEDPGYKADPDIQTISVEVTSIVGTSATLITRDTDVFYDSEILAIVHRSKVKSSGLATTKVWSWRGVRCLAGEREERKLQELARRYNTSLISVKQYAEPAELVHILGGRLATRQGSRAHWTTENTAMHIVRSVNDLTFIDELELSIKNLCSGFSYCLSILETFYVWHGRGSTTQERQAALTYARALAPNASNVIELSEEGGDDDEMFWIILGEGDYGKADYWRWKAASQSCKGRIWLVNTRQSDGVVRLVDSLANVPEVHEHVFIVDCVWEYFVLVGTEARGQRNDIRLALTVATQMSTKLAPTRPYAPTVHVLVLPSRLPIDLRLMFRDLDESHLNQGSVPEHMNLLPAKEAFEHLAKTSWERSSLKDPTMLPLGLASFS